MNENPDIKYKEITRILSRETGLGVKTVCKTISEYKKNGTITSLSKITRIRKNTFDKMDDFDKSAIRRKLHDLQLNSKAKNLLKVHKAINDDPKLPNLKKTTMYRVLKDLNFEFTNTKHNYEITERNDIIQWRKNYLKSIQSYREEERPLYFLGKTEVNIKKNQSLIVLHVGSVEGFVPGCLLYFELEKLTNEYKEELNCRFFNWFKEILLLLNDHSIVIMENLFNYSIKLDEVPVQSWKKEQIIKWLKSKGTNVPKSTEKTKLMDIVKKISPAFNKFEINDYAKQHNKTILQLPPYHCELNPINFAWKIIKDYVKTNNTTFKLSDVCNHLIEAINNITEIHWTDFENETEKTERQLREIDSKLAKKLVRYRESTSNSSDDSNDD